MSLLSGFVSAFVLFFGIMAVLLLLLLLAFSFCNSIFGFLDDDDSAFDTRPRQASIEVAWNKCESSECVICLEEFLNGDRCKTLATCNHVYHKVCIDQWLRWKRRCPICRHPTEHSNSGECIDLENK